ncbi:MAG: hypothetical protein M3P18_07475, partial [Actinomycetota bacterium]|nr:hypothetical protein [Actinomycetota bacterium]
IQNRVLLNPPWTNWFVRNGMPYSASIARSAGQPFTMPLQADPAFNAWLNAHGTHTYLRFVLEHPAYTLRGPLPYFSGEEASLNEPNRSPFARYNTQPNPKPSLLSPTANYGRHRDALPAVVQGLLFEQGQIGDVLTLAALAIGLALAAWRRFGPDPRLWVPVLVAASAIPQGYLVWLGGGEAVGELDRLSIVIAVSLRIALWIIAAFALDRIVGSRQTATSPIASAEG